MTDYEKLIKCFDEIGVDYKEATENKDKIIWLPAPFGNSYCHHIFDDNGKYKDTDGSY